MKDEQYYLIKEAAAMVGVESHVLRYWEEELKMDIHRNEMGHRYYTEKDIEILSKVRDLKEKGLQLKAIRNYLEMRREQIAKGEKQNQMDIVQVLEEREQIDHPSGKSSLEGKDPTMSDGTVQEQRTMELDKVKPIVPVKKTVLTNDEKMEQFQQIMNRILSNAIKENNELIGKSAGEHAANAVVTQINGMTKEQEARAEARYQKLDQTLREIQRARQEAAASSIRPIDKRKQKRLNRKAGQSGTPSSAETDSDS